MLATSDGTRWLLPTYKAKSRDVFSFHPSLCSLTRSAVDDVFLVRNEQWTKLKTCQMLVFYDLAVKSSYRTRVSLSRKPHTTFVVSKHGYYEYMLVCTRTLFLNATRTRTCFTQKFCARERCSQLSSGSCPEGRGFKSYRRYSSPTSVRFVLFLTFFLRRV